MRRRKFLQVAFLSTISAGCGEQYAEKRKEIGEYIEVGGELVALLPKPAAKVLGAALAMFGKALQIDYETLAGAFDQFVRPLNADEQRIAKPGLNVEVWDSRGRKFVVSLAQEIRELRQRSRRTAGSD